MTRPAETESTPRTPGPPTDGDAQERERDARLDSFRDKHDRMELERYENRPAPDGKALTESPMEILAREIHSSEKYDEYEVSLHIDAARAILALLGAAPSGEPVAWRARDEDGDGWTYFEKRPRDEWHKIEALYAGAAPAEREGLRDLAEHWSAVMDGSDALHRGDTHWQGCERVHWRCAMRQFTATLAAAPREQEPERVDMADRALLCERYWCGCERQARWHRCEDHGHLSHDEEPPTQLDHAHLYRTITTPEPPAPGETREIMDALGGEVRPSPDAEAAFAAVARSHFKPYHCACCPTRAAPTGETRGPASLAGYIEDHAGLSPIRAADLADGIIINRDMFFVTAPTGEATRLSDESTWTKRDWSAWAYRLGLKLDGTVPLIGMTNRQRIEEAVARLLRRER